MFKVRLVAGVAVSLVVCRCLAGDAAGGAGATGARIISRSGVTARIQCPPWFIADGPMPVGVGVTAPPGDVIQYLVAKELGFAGARLVVKDREGAAVKPTKYCRDPVYFRPNERVDYGPLKHGPDGNPYGGGALGRGRSASFPLDLADYFGLAPGRYTLWLGEVEMCAFEVVAFSVEQTIPFTSVFYLPFGLATNPLSGTVEGELVRGHVVLPDQRREAYVGVGSFRPAKGSKDMTSAICGLLSANCKYRYIPIPADAELDKWLWDFRSVLWVTFKCGDEFQVMAWNAMTGSHRMVQPRKKGLVALNSWLMPGRYYQHAVMVMTGEFPEWEVLGHSFQAWEEIGVAPEEERIKAEVERRVAAELQKRGLAPAPGAAPVPAPAPTPAPAPVPNAVPGAPQGTGPVPGQK